MRILNFPDGQGSPEWIVARIGLPTTSGFHRVMTPETRKYSKAADLYICELVAERLLDASLDDSWTSAYAERGTELEDEARTWYEMTRDVDVRQVGFVLRDDGRVGCSPDGLVEPDGGVEIKCLSAHRHMEVVAGGFPAMMTQVQGGMWICERDWWDVIAYNPGLPKSVIRVWRDDGYIKDLSDCMDKFLDTLDRAEDKIKQMGPGGFREIRPGDAKEVTGPVEPDPNRMSEDEIDAMRQDLHAARQAGILPPENANRVLDWAAKGEWLQARTAWSTIQNALENPEMHGAVAEAMGAVQGSA